MKNVKYVPLRLPIFNTGRTTELFHINPTLTPVRSEPPEIHVQVYDFTGSSIEEHTFKSVAECGNFNHKESISWINIDGIRKEDVEKITAYFGIHPLISEDIMSVGQRPKMDEMDNGLFCLLNMLYFNDNKNAVEQEQISIVLGKNFVITFQEDAVKDVFNPLREKLKHDGSRLRQGGADYLCYAIIDMIVDNYFVVLDKLGEKIEVLEDDIVRNANTRSLARINNLRKELIVLKRNFGPVREIVNGFMRSDSELLEEKTIQYFKDIYDHIVQANDLSENYRDMMINLQDLYLNKVNLRQNEAMKVMAIATCLMAPATVIGGIFGMNFDIIPLSHQQMGFHFAVGVMLIIPVVMIFIFKKRGWF